MHFVITHMPVISCGKIENPVPSFRENIWHFNSWFHWNSYFKWFEVSYLALTVKNLHVFWGKDKLSSPSLEIIQLLVFITDLIYKTIEKCCKCINQNCQHASFALFNQVFFRGWWHCYCNWCFCCKAIKDGA